MAADVTIKNIPLSYLKNQNQSFFGSESYSDAVDLFNKFKRPVPESESSDTLEKVLLPLDTLKAILLNKYKGLPFESDSTETHEDLIFINLSGKTGEMAILKPRKYITRCANEIIESNGFLARVVVSNPLIGAARKAKTNVSTSVVQNDLLKSILKPEETIDPVADITARSKFYEKTIHPDVYDDKAYTQSIFKRIATNMTFALTAMPLNGLRYSLVDKYVTENKDMKLAVEDLKVKLLYKLLNRNGIEDSLNRVYPTATNDILFHRIQKNIEISLAAKTKGLRLNIFKDTVFDASGGHIITHNKDTLDFRFVGYDLNGKDITSLIEFSVIDENSVFFSTNTVIPCTVLLVFDNEAKTIATKSFYNYQKEISAKLFDQYLISTSSDKAIIYIDNYDVDLGFIEVCTAEEKIPVVPTKIQFFDNRLELTFDRDYTNLEVYILPTYRILAGMSNIKVLPSTVKVFLNKYNIFADNVTVWRDTI